MSIYVDPLMRHGWVLRGRKTLSCHMFTDGLDLEPLHAFAERIGLRREWLHDAPSAPHYDLTPPRRLAAVVAGAIEVDRVRAGQIWRARWALLHEESISRAVIGSDPLTPTTPSHASGYEVRSTYDAEAKRLTLSVKFPIWDEPS